MASNAASPPPSVAEGCVAHPANTIVARTHRLMATNTPSSHPWRAPAAGSVARPRYGTAHEMSSRTLSCTDLPEPHRWERWSCNLRRNTRRRLVGREIHGASRRLPPPHPRPPPCRPRRFHRREPDSASRQAPSRRTRQRLFGWPGSSASLTSSTFAQGRAALRIQRAGCISLPARRAVARLLGT